MEMKPPVMHTPVVMPAPAPAPMPVPMPVPMPHHDNHVHLHASYKHTAIVLPEIKPVVHAPVVVPCYSNYGAVLVLFILLVIITRGLFL
ncbi:hypothetical protein ACFFK0_07580 [Paenibacillus chartarius]|uniref:Uncharacterized protein n=1 Tax=Paenibacillus chartarius TaxID=747481 RepID=A0ABV6DI51_9BACL